MQALLLFFALLVPLVAGLLLARLFPLGFAPVAGLTILRMSLALGLGFGMAAVGCFLWLLAFGSVGKWFFAVETLLCVALGLVAQRGRAATRMKLEQRSPSPLSSPPEGSGNARHHTREKSPSPPPVPKAFGVEGEGRVRGVVRNPSSQTHPEPGLSKPFRIFVLSALAVAGIAALCSFLVWSRVNPHGGWDTWAIWNLRARFLFRAGEHWKDLFALDLGFWSHADYPLLIPGIVARCWFFVGTETQLVPSIISLLFACSTLALLTSSLTILRSKTQGCLAGLLFICTPLVLRQCASQQADIPVGFYFLATLVLLTLAVQYPHESCSLCLLAGITASLAAWTKNEGLLFFACVLLSRLVALIRAAIPYPSPGLSPEGRGADSGRPSETASHISSPPLAPKAFGVGGEGKGEGYRCASPTASLRLGQKQLLAFALGALPVIALVIYFKTLMPQPNDLLGQLSAFREFTSISRYLTILAAFGHQISDFGGMLVKPALMLGFYLLLVGVDVQRKERVHLVMLIAILLLMAMGYFFAFVLSPYDLGWHLKTALSRLAMQLWPSLLFVFFYAVRSPEKTLSNNRMQIRNPKSETA